MIVNFDEFNSIPGIFYHQANDLKDQPYLWKKENNKYVSLSWSQVKEQIESLAILDEYFFSNFLEVILSLFRSLFSFLAFGDSYKSFKFQIGSFPRVFFVEF